MPLEHKVGGNTVEACFKEGKENHLRTSTTARSKSVREKFNAKRKGKGQGQLQRRLIDESSNKTVEEEYEGPYDVDPEEEGTEVEAEVESVESQEEEGLPDVADHREREDGDDDNDKESATTVGSFEYIKYLDESGAVRLQRKLTGVAIYLNVVFILLIISASVGHLQLLWEIGSSNQRLVWISSVRSSFLT